MSDTMSEVICTLCGKPNTGVGIENGGCPCSFEDMEAALFRAQRSLAEAVALADRYLREREQAKRLGDRLIATAHNQGKREAMEYAEQLTAALGRVRFHIDAIVPKGATDAEIIGDALREIDAALAKNPEVQCGGSRSLTEAPRSSTAQPLPAAHKADKQLDAGLPAQEPASQREPRTTLDGVVNHLKPAPMPTEEEVLRAVVANQGRALKFYARRGHYCFDGEPGDWDSVSGEPPNWLCPPEIPPHTAPLDLSWMIEDGGIARAALAGEYIEEDAEPESQLDSQVTHLEPKP